MVVESISIIVIFLVMIFIFLRAGKKSYAIATAPLLLVPAFQIVASVLNKLIDKNVSMEMKTLILIVGLAVSLVLIGVISSILKDKKSRLIYILLCGGFSTTLAIIFIYHNYAV